MATGARPAGLDTANSSWVGDRPASTTQIQDASEVSDSESSASWMFNEIINGGEFQREDELLSDEEYWDSEEEADSEPTPNPIRFSLFSRLPPELRMYIWEAYCPELIADSRVLEFDVDLTRRRTGGPEECLVFNGIFLRTATHRMRKVLAVNRESRQLALRYLPDALVFSHFDGLPEQNSVVHFNSKKDVIYLKGFFDVPPLTCLPPAFAQMVTNVGVDVPLSSRKLNVKAITSLLSFFGTLPNLRNVLYCQCTYDLTPEDMKWWTDGTTFNWSYIKARKLYIDFCHFRTRTVMTVWPKLRAREGLKVPGKFVDAARAFTTRAEDSGFNVLPMMFLDAKKEVKKFLHARTMVRVERMLEEEVSEMEALASTGDEPTDGVHEHQPPA